MEGNRNQKPFKPKALSDEIGVFGLALKYPRQSTPVLRKSRDTFIKD
jgi:hypothetical protein